MRSNVFDPADENASLRLFNEPGRDAADGQAVAGRLTAATPAAPDEVLSIEDLATRFNVSTKTISRWRDHGLVAERHVVGGRRRPRTPPARPTQCEADPRTSGK